MKIAHYSTSLSRSAGGLFYSVSGLAKGQMVAGSDVLVVGGADHYFEQDRNQWDDVQIRLHNLKHGSYGLSAQAIRALVNFKPDVIHVHGIWTAASFYARTFSAVGVPLVMSPRGMLDPWILARKQAIKRIHAALFERPALRKAHIHALSQSEYESVVRFMPRSAERTFIIPNGIGAAVDNGQTDRAGVLYLGRLHAKKQVVELARLWRNSHRLQQATLTIAGWGDSEYEQELRSAVEGAANVRFIGPLYGEAKDTALSSARFFILPSLSEGLPMAALEALQHGAIPIITDQCNLPELFDAGVAIRINANLQDTQLLVAAALQRSAGELETLSKAGIEFSRRYLWSTIARQMHAQYESILK